MPAAAVVVNFLNGWVDTSSVASTGSAHRRLITGSYVLIVLNDVRM